MNQGRSTLNTGMRQAIRILPGPSDFLSFEGVFALYVTAGQFKGTALFQWAPVDLTAFFAALSLMTGIVVTRRRGWAVPRRAVLPSILCAMFAWYVLLSSVWTPTQADLTKAYLMMPLLGWAFVGAVVIIAPEPERVARFLRMWILVAIYLFGISIDTLLRFGDELGSALSVFGSDYITRGLLQAIGAVVLLGFSLAVYPRRPIRATLGITLVLLLTIGVLITGSRQAFIGVMLALPLPLFVLVRPTRTSILVDRRVAVLVTLVTIGVVAATQLSIAGFNLPAISRLTALFTSGLDESVSQRQFLLEAALAGAPDRIVLGHGVASFGANHSRNPLEHPHNTIVEILYELGIVGVALFLGLVLSCAWNWRPPPDWLADPTRLIVVQGLIILGVAAMVSNSYAESRQLLCFLALLVYGVGGERANDLRAAGGTTGALQLSR